MGDLVRLALCGDVMLGRGVDQILPHPGDPTLREGYVKDARTYVELAEQVNGPVPRAADPAWPWGDVLPVLAEAAPDVRVVNLETSITTSDDFATGKGINYRMHPGNVAAVAAAAPDVCVLANNHVLDFGPSGLVETLEVLDRAGLRRAGAGRDAEEARRPAIVPLASGGRLLVFAVATMSSGVPPDWQATDGHPGVEVLHEPLAARSPALVDRIGAWKEPGDLVVVSVHWGSNWGYGVLREHTRLAHALVDGGADLVHGHSSHHPRPIERHRGKLVLYGCGDLVNDYEGIGGHEEHRSDLRLLYLADVEAGTGELAALRMAPFRARRLRLEHASDEDAAWLQAELDRESRAFGARVERDGGILTVRGA